MTAGETDHERGETPTADPLPPPSSVDADGADDDDRTATGTDRTAADPADGASRPEDHPTTADGDPSRVEDHPTTADGDPSRVEDHPTTAEVPPAESSGRVTIVGGAPNGTGREPATTRPDVVDPDEPHLGGHDAASPSPEQPAPSPRAGAVPSASAYRNPDERNRSVYRRANPWYRRLARGLVALCFIGALGVGIYVGARAIQDYINRDQLPPEGADVPPIRQTAILIVSTSSALQLQGTLTFDTVSGAYEFVGLAGSPNATDRLTSPDGEEVLILNQDATWRSAAGDEPIVDTIERAIDVLSDDTTADVILTNQVRRGFVDLIDETEEGPESDALNRYDVALDLTGFAGSFPLQWDTFQEDAIPGLTESRRHELSIWLDEESVLVRVQDDATGWNWERLAYADVEYVPFQPPATQVLDPETQEPATGVDCRIDGLDIGWSTTLPTCDESQSVGRQLAASAGLADDAATPAAELAFASVCSTLQSGEPRTFDEPAYLELAGLLVDAGVCPGDTALVQLDTDS